jgi:hypothetical protein
MKQRLDWFGLVLILATSLVLPACSLIQGVDAPIPTVAAPATVPPTEEAEVAQEATSSPAPTLTTAPTNEPTIEPTLEPTIEPTIAVPPETETLVETAELPEVVEYNLGDAVIIQDWFAEDFLIRGMKAREMPVRLNGIISVPREGEGPFPVVMILHGTHPGCPTGADGSVDFWPCDPEAEQANYRGFDYLVQRLAAEGYIAFAPNINAVNTFGYGEANGEDQVGARLFQIVDLHLQGLAEASGGGANNFGITLENQADLRRLAFIGHSRGSENANWLVHSQGLDSPLSFTSLGYGPVKGVLLIAPAAVNFPLRSAGVPLSIILPACDGDVNTQEGQLFYENVRLDPNAPEWVTSAWLEAANHNGFNTILGPDLFGNPDRPDCESILSPEVQQAFMGDYATAFLTTIFSPDPQAILAAKNALGLDVTVPAPDELFGLEGRLASLAAPEDRLTLLLPAEAADLAQTQQGGAVVADNLTMTFCPSGYFLSAEFPGTEPCRRRSVVVPGNPSLLVASWETEDGELRLELPEGAGDLSRFEAISMRAALDPLSPLNSPEASQSFSVRLTDAAGNTAVTITQPDEPSLRYPEGEFVDEDSAEGPRFTGRVPLTTLRLPLDNFAGVDLANIREIALVFDQTPRGTLFIADIELVRPAHLIGAYSSLLDSESATHELAKAIARFDGASTCTGTFIDTGGGPEAPAYLLTNGHCAQEWEANAVYVDLPAEGWQATFNYFIDSQDNQINIPAAGVAYSTMKGRDIAIIELDATVGELMAQEISPIELAEVEPEGSWPMTVIGAPVTGVPLEIAYLREEICAASGRVDLFEFIWHFTDAFRNSCQDIYGGSSGSPVFERDKTQIVGLMNTTNLGAITPCYLGAPCEVTTEGTVFRPDTSYATPVVGLDFCFDESGRFTLDAEGCPLDDGRQLLVSGSPSQGVQPVITELDGTQRSATWNASLSGELPYYRYKTGRAGQVDCTVDDAYGPPIALADLSVIDDLLPAEEGSYLLCLLAGENPIVDDTWQLPERATIARALIDTTPPTVEPTFSILPDGTGGFMVDPIFAIGELVNYRLKVGPNAETDCASEDDYLPYRRFPVNVPADQIPAKVCVIGSDYAGNEAPPYELLVGQP